MLLGDEFGIIDSDVLGADVGSALGLLLGVLDGVSLVWSLF